MADRPGHGVGDRHRGEGDVAGVGHQVAVGDRRCPAAEKLAMLADFTRAMSGLGGRDGDRGRWPSTLGPLGGVPVAVPVLVMRPASTSAWVVV